MTPDQRLTVSRCRAAALIAAVAAFVVLSGRVPGRFPPGQDARPEAPLPSPMPL